MSNCGEKYLLEFERTLEKKYIYHKKLCTKITLKTTYLGKVQLQPQPKVRLLH